MQTSFIVFGSIIFSLGFIVYKKFAEPISLFVINESIKISKDDFEKIDKENQSMIIDVEKLQQALKRGEVE